MPLQPPNVTRAVVVLSDPSGATNLSGNITFEEVAGQNTTFQVCFRMC